MSCVLCVIFFIDVHLQSATCIPQHTGGHPGHAVHGKPGLCRQQPAAAILEQLAVQGQQPVQEQLAVKEQLATEEQLAVQEQQPVQEQLARRRAAGTCSHTLDIK